MVRHCVALCHSGSTLASINKFTLCWAQLVLGWVTVSGVQHLVPETYLSHPGQLSLAIPSWVGAMSTSQKDGDALWLGSKGRYGSCVGGR